MGYTKPDAGKRHLVLDLETLALHPHAAITEIGIIDLLTDQTLSLKINPHEQREGFVQDPQTIEWHLKRDPSYLINLAHTGVRPCTAAGNLHNWLMQVKANSDKELVIWCQGTDFDIPIITNFLKHYQYHLPWGYTNVRDIRTLAALFPEVEYKKGNHTALEDATMAAQYLRKLAFGSHAVSVMLGLA
ncbi:hypothetical protein D3C87_600990 [compost metagenome]